MSVGWRRWRFVHPGLSVATIFLLSDAPTTEIYTLSLHDALPIFLSISTGFFLTQGTADTASWRIALTRSGRMLLQGIPLALDRKSTRLNSSHQIISYAVFCLKKKRRKDRERLLCAPCPRGRKSAR